MEKRVNCKLKPIKEHGSKARQQVKPYLFFRIQQFQKEKNILIVINK